MKTIPDGFTLTESLIPGAGRGIISLTFVPRFTWLGEYEGVVRDAHFYDESRNPNLADYAWIIHPHKVYGSSSVVNFIVLCY